MRVKIEELLADIKADVDLAAQCRARMTPFRRAEETERQTLSRLFEELVEHCPQYNGWYLPPQG
jgi:hypothetical protein